MLLMFASVFYSCMASSEKKGNNPPDRNRSIFQKRGTGKCVKIKGTTLEYLSTSPLTEDAMGIYRVTIAPESPGAGLHYHQRMTETFEIQKGILSMMLDGQAVEAEEGDFVLVSPGSIHGFANHSKMPVVFTLTFTPALAREGFFEGLAELADTQRLTDKNAMLTLMEKYDQVPVEGVEAWNRKI